MILALDAGNTRVKWGVFDDAGQLTQTGAAENRDPTALEEQLKNAHGASRAVVSCVAGEVVATQLSRVLNALNLPARWIKPQAAACGVRNGYHAPETLGSDRWAALIAAWNLHHAPCVVVNAGTAMTVDALSAQGEFLGGLIVPGMGMMRDALARGTSVIALPTGEWRDFPQSTADAAQSGLLAAAMGAVRHMEQMLAQHEGRAPRLILSGGDADMLADVLNCSSLPPPEKSGEEPLIIPHLVLRGLLFLEKTTP
ncbi:MAG: type III pantothenate kinase [Methylobacillus sp.]|jgi:type III pantothenate kinase|nr:type III pantothenate kinase [Methylobacillus sp.]